MSPATGLVLDRSHGTSPFVGRAGELRVLTDLLREACELRGGVVLLAGEPGIGKTRLLDTLIAEATDGGATVLRGRCWEDAGAPPFWPWVEVLEEVRRGRVHAELRTLLGRGAPAIAALVPGIAEALPDVEPPADQISPSARFRLLESVAHLLKALATPTRPLLVVIDDLHGADRSSLLLLEFVARAIRDSPLLVVGAYRDTGLVAEPLRSTLGELRRTGVRAEIVLAGLDRKAIAGLVAAVGGGPASADVVATLHERTAGNPLFVTELLRLWLAEGRGARALSAGIPGSVRAAIARRIETLALQTRPVLGAAAVLGREFDRRVLARMADLDSEAVAEALGEAEEAGLLTSARGFRCRFAHALVGEVLVAELSGAERVRLHRRAGEALIASDSEGALADIVRHFVEANDARVATYAHAAGNRALGLLAYEEAIRLYGVALDGLGAADDPDETRRADLLLALGDAQKRSGDDMAAGEVLGRVIAIARRRSSPELLTRAALATAPRVNLGEAAPETATVLLLEEAVAAWQGRDAPLHARALARLAAAAYFLPAGRAPVLAREAVAMARRVGDAATLGQVLVLGNVVLWGVEPPDLLLSDMTEATRVAEQAGDRESAIYAQGWRVHYSLALGDVVAASAAFAECRRLADALRQPVFDWYCESMLTARAIDEGRFAEAERLAPQAFALREGDAAAANMFSVQMMAIRDFQGRLAEVAPMARQLAEMSPLPAVRAVVAYVESQVGDVSAARAIVEQLAVGGFDAMPRDGARLLALVRLADVCTVLDDAEHAAALYEVLAPHAAECVLRGQAGPSLGPVDYYLGLLAGTLGRLDEADAHFAAARAVDRRTGAQPLAARALAAHARLLERRGAPGDPERAEVLAAEALAIADAIGMRGLCEQLHEGRPSATSASGGGVSETVFRRDGDYWTIGYVGRTIRLQNIRGLQYLARLVLHPGREFHVSELVAADGGADAVPLASDEYRIVRDPGQGEPSLDREAATAYRRRLAFLEDAVEEAERGGDMLRAQALHAERASLRSELADRARTQRGTSHAERARQAVTKSIKAALTRIAAAHPGLGEHFAATVRRGYFCAYVPDPRHPITWEG